MVGSRTGSWAVLLGCFVVEFLTASASGSDAPQRSNPVEQVRSALGSGSFPWYDSKTDRVKPVDLPEPPKPKQPSPATKAGWSWSDFLVFGGFLVGFVVLAGLIWRFWKRFEPISDPTVDAVKVLVARSSGEVLPSGLRRDAGDPWSEANRLRFSGDFAGAILCVFAHQLLTVSRLGLVRLAPGRTGRQLHRAVGDAEFQTLMAPTLRQFEAIYYGHRTPSASDFATVWTSAEAFERRAAQGVPR